MSGHYTLLSHNIQVKKESSCADCDALAQEFEKNPGGKPVSNKGLIFAGITGGAAIVLSTICLPFVTPALRRVCLPFVPATDTQINNVVRALHNAPKSLNNKLVDIGSGDGRIVSYVSMLLFKGKSSILKYSSPWI